LDLIDLNAIIRKTTGNGPARQLRATGQMPGILYGPDMEPIMLAITVSDLDKVLKTSNIGQVLLNLTIKNGKTITKTAMIKELQRQPVSGEFLHVDFYEVAMDRKIRVSVPIVATGNSVGVELGGVLQIVRREVEVLCLPNEIPETIEVDVTDLDVGDSLHVNDIPLERDIEIQADMNFTVITVLSPTKEEEEVVEELEEEEGEALEAADDEEAAEPADEE
jgi:large subunit ribosomal protein L25